MTEPMPGGRRRIDRVLAEGFLEGITSASMVDVRTMRHEAEQEEADLSYTRRLLQGRMDIVKAEIARRSAPEGESDHVVDHLVEILADEPSSHTSHGISRHITVEPSRVDEHRREVEKIVADAGLSDVEARTEDELREALTRLADYERQVSGSRRRVQQVMDACTAEVSRRYRDGEANVDDLLAGPRGETR
ncbi:MAG: aerial mycelium formation protein [Actinomycetes bacterium]